jgi:hypothetical protein
MPRLLHSKIQAFNPVMENGAGKYSFPVLMWKWLHFLLIGNTWGFDSLLIRRTIIGDHRTPVRPLSAFGTMIHGKIVELAARHP